MRAVNTDYYELLGISRDADTETIQKAFHAAARDVHPDVSDSPDAERRFRELAEAYSVLSKPDSRFLYDRFGYRGRGNRGFDEALWDERADSGRGDNIHVPVELRPYEAAEGGSRLVRYQAVDVCPHCGGRGTEEEADPDCPDCGGTGHTRKVAHLEVARILQLDACPTCTGGACQDCEGTGLVRVDRKLRVRIPSGVEDCAQLRVGGEGDLPDPGGVPGDLLLNVSVLPEPRDHRGVRYLALALFAVAATVLAAYLLLH